MTENCKLLNAILSAFYNISQRNFGILLILWCSFKPWWNFCLDQNLVCNASGPLRGIHATRVYKKAQSCKYCQMFVQIKWLFYVENGHDLN
jgi:hypothetical protein